MKTPRQSFTKRSQTHPRRSRTNCLLASLAWICPENLKKENWEFECGDVDFSLGYPLPPSLSDERLRQNSSQTDFQACKFSVLYALLFLLILLITPGWPIVCCSCQFFGNVWSRITGHKMLAEFNVFCLLLL